MAHPSGVPCRSLAWNARIDAAHCTPLGCGYLTTGFYNIHPAGGSPNPAVGANSVRFSLYAVIRISKQHPIDLWRGGV